MSIYFVITSWLELVSKCNQTQEPAWSDLHVTPTSFDPVWSSYWGIRLEACKL